MTTGSTSEACFDFYEGTLPLLVSVPHDGRLVPPEVMDTMTPAGKAIEDTDWHVAELYEFAKSFGASLLVARISRYVVDLNRSANNESLYDGRFGTGLFPQESFSGLPLYIAGESIDAAEQSRRLESFWSPYHDKLSSTLAALRKRYGYALLWDAHSIASEVPVLFDGELPELNFGSYDGKSCAAQIAAGPIEAAKQSAYDTVVNARFKGGFITRQYGRPEEDRHALQLEIAQRTYMHEDTHDFNAEKASRLRMVLRSMLTSFVESAEQYYAQNE